MTLLALCIIGVVIVYVIYSLKLEKEASIKESQETIESLRRIGKIIVENVKKNPIRISLDSFCQCGKSSNICPTC